MFMKSTSCVLSFVRLMPGLLQKDSALKGSFPVLTATPLLWISRARCASIRLLVLFKPYMLGQLRVLPYFICLFLTSIASVLALSTGVLFEFPREPIGWLAKLNKTGETRLTEGNSQLLAEAKNKVALQENPELLALVLNNRAVKDLSFLKLLPANSLRIVCFSFTKLDDEDLEKLSSLFWLPALDLSSSQVRDAGLKHLSRLKEMSDLYLDSLAIEGEGLKYLKDCPKLSLLSLNDCHLKEQHLSKLSQLKSLRHLFLKSSCLNDKNFRLLLELKNLQSLDLELCRISDDSIELLLQKLPLEKLVIRNTPVTGSFLRRISKTKLSSLDLANCNFAGCKRAQFPQTLKILSLKGLSGISDDFVRQSNLEKLGLLDLSKTKITAACLPKLSESKDLKELRLGNLDLSGAELKVLTKLENLKTLNLIACKLNSSQLGFLLAMKSLSGLDLSHNPIDSDSLKTLSACKNLKVLRLSYTDLSKKDLLDLQKKLKNCRIVHEHQSESG